MKRCLKISVIFLIGFISILFFGSLRVSAAVDAKQFLGLGKLTHFDAIGENIEVVVPDGSGGFYAVYGEVTVYNNYPSDRNDYNLYLQRYDESINALWAGKGVSLGTNNDNNLFPENQPRLVLNGSDGVFVSWMEQTSSVGAIGTYYSYVQKIDMSGNKLWSDPGIEISRSDYLPGDTIENMYLVTSLLADGAGGVFVGFTNWDDNIGYSRVVVQKLDTGGVKQWGADGLELSATAKENSYPAIYTDESGGIIAVWTNEDVNGDGEIYLQRINSGGATVWPSNVASNLYFVSNNLNTALIYPGTGIVVVGKSKLLDGLNRDFAAQLVNFSGALQWGGGSGIILQDNSAIPTIVNVHTIDIIKAQNDLIAVWARLDNLTWELFARKFEIDGDVLWGAPVEVSDSTPSYNYPSYTYRKNLYKDDGFNIDVAHNNKGGVIVEWMNSGTNSMFYQEIDSDGSLPFGATGKEMVPSDTPTGKYPDLENYITYSEASPTSSITRSFKVPTSSDRLLAVQLSYTNGSSNTVSSVTFDGNSLVRKCTKQSNNYYIELWYLINPPETTADVVVNFSGDVNYPVFGASSFSSVNQTQPFSFEICTDDILSQEDVPGVSLAELIPNVNLLIGSTSNTTVAEGVTDVSHYNFDSVSTPGSSNTVTVPGFAMNSPANTAIVPRNADDISDIIDTTNTITLPSFDPGFNQDVGRFIGAVVSYREGPDVNVTTVKIGTQNFSFGCRANNNGFVVEIWYTDFAKTTTGDVVATLTANAPEKYMGVAAFGSDSRIYVGTEDIKCSNNSGAWSATPNISFDLSAGELIFGGGTAYVDSVVLTPDAGVTNLWGGSAYNTYSFGGYQNTVGAGSVLGWNIGPEWPWSIGAIKLKPYHSTKTFEYLVVGASYYTGAGELITSVDYGGQAVGAVAKCSSSENGYVTEIWALADPIASSSDVIVTFSDSVDYPAIGAMSFSASTAITASYLCATEVVPGYRPSADDFTVVSADNSSGNTFTPEVNVVQLDTYNEGGGNLVNFFCRAKSDTLTKINMSQDNDFSFSTIGLTNATTTTILNPDSISKMWSVNNANQLKSASGWCRSTSCDYIGIFGDISYSVFDSYAAFVLGLNGSTSLGSNPMVFNFYGVPGSYFAFKTSDSLVFFLDNLNKLSAVWTDISIGTGDIFTQKFFTKYQISGLPGDVDALDLNSSQSIKLGEAEGLLGTDLDVRIIDDTDSLIVSDIKVDFVDVDNSWASVDADSDAVAGKSVVANLGSAPGAAATHTLYVPKLPAHNRVRVCPSVDTLIEVVAGCAGEQIKQDGDAGISIENVSGVDYWKIVGVSGTGGEGFTYVATFPFSLTSPISGAESADNTPLLDWETSTDTDFASYEVYLDGNLVSTVNTVSDSQFQVVTELINGTHNWKVIAKKTDTSTSHDTGLETFNVNAVESGSSFPFTLILPIGVIIADNTPLFQWNASSDPDLQKYLIYLDNVLYTEVNQPSTEFQTTTPLTNGDHFWQVVSVNNSNVNTYFTAFAYFSITPEGGGSDILPPSSPVVYEIINLNLLYPVNNSVVNDSNVTLDWEINNLAGVYKYRIYLNLNLIATINYLNGTEYTVTGLENGNYEWRVEALSVSDTVLAESVVESFVVELTDEVSDIPVVTSLTTEVSKDVTAPLALGIVSTATISAGLTLSGSAILTSAGLNFFDSIRFVVFALFRRKKKTWSVVFDKETLKPIAFAVIRLVDSSTILNQTVSDLQGRFGLAYSKKGNYNVTIDATGYRKYSVPIALNRLEDLDNLDAGIIKEDFSIFIVTVRFIFDSLKYLFRLLNIALLLLMLFGSIITLEQLLLSFDLVELVLLMVYLCIGIYNAVNIYKFLRPLKAGKVKDQSTKKGLRGVIIKLFSSETLNQVASVITNENGDFRVNLPEGIYLLRAYVNGYKTLDKKNVKVSENGYFENDILLEKSTGVVENSNPFGE